jgi:RNA-binding protein
LQRLGRVLHVSQSRNIIITIENLPKIGETVVNENLKPIGKILDIFGPVSSPYASVKPKIQEIEKLTDRMLYVLPSKGRKGKI